MADDRTFNAYDPARGGQPMVAVYPPRRSLLGRLLVGLILICVLVLLLLFIGLLASLLAGAAITGNLNERHFSHAKLASNKVAILTLDGTISDDDDSFLKKQIDQVREDKEVKALVLRVNSPGGTMTGSDYLHHELRKLVEERQIPIVASFGGLAASGGYYIAMAVGPTEDVIFAEPTSWTGSIGVVIPHFNVAELMDTVGVEETPIKSHRLKQMGSPFKKLNDEEIAIFQGLVDDGFARFREIVQYGRARYAKTPADFDSIATGQIYTTKQALANGLVDKEGFIEDAIARVMTLASLDGATTKVVKYEKPESFWDSVTAGAIAKSRSFSNTALLESIHEMATPRAYYLFTSFPIGMSSNRN